MNSWLDLSRNWSKYWTAAVKEKLEKDINHFGQPTNQKNPIFVFSLLKNWYYSSIVDQQIKFHIFNIMTTHTHRLGSSSDRWCNDALFLWTAVCGDCSHQREVDLHSKHAHVPSMTFNCVEGCQANIMILFSILNWIQLRPIVRDHKKSILKQTNC